MRRVLVTGGAGFIGAHLVRALLARGDTVRIVDNFVTGTARNLSAALDLPRAQVEGVLAREMVEQTALTSRCTIVVGDICDPNIIRTACEDIEVVFHQAALRSVPRSGRSDGSARSQRHGDAASSGSSPSRRREEGHQCVLIVSLRRYTAAEARRAGAPASIAIRREQARR